MAHEIYPRCVVDFRSGRRGRAVDPRHLDENSDLRGFDIPGPPEDCFSIQHRSPLQGEVDVEFDENLQAARGLLNGVVATVVIVAVVVGLLLYAVGV